MREEIKEEVIEISKNEEKAIKTESKKDDNLIFEAKKAEVIEVSKAEEKEINKEAEEAKKEKTKDDESKKETEEPAVEDKKKGKKKTDGKEKKPTSKNSFYIQLVFVIISAIFILGCCIFYGIRFVKYYKIFNPKTEEGEKVTLIGNAITEKAQIKTDGDGLYKIGSGYA